MDYHGDADPRLVNALSIICHVILVHISSSKFESGQLVDLVQILLAVETHCQVIILIRDSKSCDIVEEAEKAVYDRSKRSRGNLKFVYIPEYYDGQSFEMQFASFLETNFAVSLGACNRIPRKALLYDELESVLQQQAVKHGNLLSLSTRSLECCMLSNSLRGLLSSLTPATVTGSLFPRTCLYNELIQLEDQLHKVELTAKTQKEKNEEEAHIRMKQENIEIELQKQGELHEALQLFNNIILAEVISWYDEYMAVIKSISLDNLKLSMEQFWREIMFFNKDADKEKRKSIIKFAKQILNWGYPIELLNGDSLTMMSIKYLEEIFEDNVNSLLVCSVIGPQSSAKSTLMNYLFGSSFQVSAGRCTKGMHLSLFNTDSFGLKHLAVLDTEGLLSATSRDGAFDKQMSLMALALSNVVLINIKGEIGAEMKHVLDVTLLGLKKLQVIHAQPLLLFVLRDMTDLDREKQMESIERVRTDMKEICKRIDFNMKELDKENFILLPPAISPSNTKCLFAHNILFSRNPIFSDKTVDLLELICAKQAKKYPAIGAETFHNLPFTSMRSWVQHINSTWACVKQSGHLLHYKTLQEYFDRSKLSEITSKICEDNFNAGFFEEALQLLNGTTILNFQNPAQSKLQFRNVVESQLLPKYFNRALDQFHEKTAGRNLADNLVEEYRQCLQTHAQMTLDACMQEINFRIDKDAVQKYSQAGIDEIKTWIDTNAPSRIYLAAKKPNEGAIIKRFEEFWQEQRRQLEEKLQKPASDNADAWRRLRDIFVNAMTYKSDLAQFTISFTYDSELELFKQVQKAVNKKSITDDLLYTCCISKPPHIIKLFLQRSAITESFYEAFHDISSSIQDYVRNGSKPAQTQAALTALDQKIRQRNAILRQNHIKIIPKFYSICYTALFHTFLEQIEADEQNQRTEALLEFDNHKIALQRSFLYLLRSRYDDKKAAKNLAVLLVGSLREHANNVANEELQKLLRFKAAMSPQQLNEKCLKRKTDEDIFNYITNCPKFMQDTFTDIFDSGLADLKPTFENRYKEIIHDDMVVFLGIIQQWRQKLAEKSLQQSLEKYIQQGRTEDTQLVASLLFQSFKALLSNTKQPHVILSDKTFERQIRMVFNSLQAQARDYFSSGNQNANVNKMRDFSKLFSLVPNSCVIVSPTIFCDELNRTLPEVASGFHRFKINQFAVKNVHNMLSSNAIGCLEVCPHCKAKCTEPNNGHKKHATDFHRISAFAGVHGHGTKNFCFSICTSIKHQGCKWIVPNTPDDDPNPVKLSFSELMTKHHPDWIIPLRDDMRIETENILMWLQVRKKLCNYYKLSDNTPSEWLEIENGRCPICLERWDNPTCGPKKALPCDHHVGEHCYGRLLLQPSAQRLCPLCRIPILK